MMGNVYLLQHTYFYGDNDEHEETKILGIFDSRDKAQAAITQYIELPGFKDFSDECFSIDEYQLNKTEWAEGFVE